MSLKRQDVFPRLEKLQERSDIDPFQGSRFMVGREGVMGDKGPLLPKAPACDLDAVQIGDEPVVVVDCQPEMIEDRKRSGRAGGGAGGDGGPLSQQSSCEETPPGIHAGVHPSHFRQQRDVVSVAVAERRDSRCPGGVVVTRTSPGPRRTGRLRNSSEEAPELSVSHELHLLGVERADRQEKDGAHRQENR